MFTSHFYGNEISDYGKEHGFVDYRTLAKSFDAVMCNSITEMENFWNDATIENGSFSYYEDADGNEISGEEYDRQTNSYTLGGEYFDGDSNEITEEEYNRNAEAYENEIEVFQWFIISGNGAEILEELTDEIVIYYPPCDMYIWGVTHWGTSWDYVLTSIECEKVEKTA